MRKLNIRTKWKPAIKTGGIPLKNGAVLLLIIVNSCIL